MYWAGPVEKVLQSRVGTGVDYNKDKVENSREKYRKAGKSRVE